ncbi:hypothetical protein AMJ40_00640 [candidate division TA06 bacterium DG_26]|uniref:histidine kinase n=1 Tax=candidate division TA06 bacterium DG_26 TaxID=1703771 RepID=A0A0S7WNF2_UNCT6|nr:MAG: hypothetical protein AMJ40_00640 [candidate division TA06 bacterium DG_26]
MHTCSGTFVAHRIRNEMDGLRLSHKSTILTLRWLTVLLVVLLMMYSQKGLVFGTGAYLLGVAFLLSNIILSFIPQEKFARPTISSIVVVADAIFVSLAIYLTSGFNTDFYLIYFLVIFIAAMRQDLKGSVMAGAVAISLYGWLVARSSPDFDILSTPFLIRGVFFMLVATFSGFLAQRTKVSEEARSIAEMRTRELERRLRVTESMSDISIEKLKELHHYNESILESISSGILVVDLTQIVTTFNEGAQKVTGVPSEKVLGREVGSIPGWQKGFAQTISDTVLMRREVQNREVEIIDASGRRIPLGITTSLLRSGNQTILGAIAIFRDISEIKELQEKVRRSDRLALVGQMASCVAHEIRGPLCSISGFAQLLSSKEASDKTKKYAQIIVGEAERIETIITDILGWAKEIRIERRPVDLNHIVIDVSKSLEEKARKAAVAIQTELEETLPVISADPEHVRAVVYNLATNAIQAMKDGGVLRIETSRDGDGVTLEVSDTGEGIPRELQSQIWEPFFSTKKAGTGLGLAITRRILEAHGGTITLSSIPGQGAKFSVVLPIEEVEAYARK